MAICSQLNKLLLLVRIEVYRLYSFVSKIPLNISHVHLIEFYSQHNLFLLPRLISILLNTSKYL